MSAANNGLNLFNFEFNYPFERHSPLWVGTGRVPTLSPTSIVSPLFEPALFFAKKSVFEIFKHGRKIQL
jgi:hypothetical protein